MKNVLKVATLAMIGLGISNIALAQQKLELRAADYWDDEYPTVQGLKKFGEILGQRSHGRITLKVFANGALGAENETLDLVKAGKLDLARVNISSLNNNCPETLVPTLPFLFNSVEHMHKALDGGVGDEILASCETQGYVGLAYYDGGARSIYTRKAIRSIADMKGVKLRVQQSDLWIQLATAMGATPVSMPMGEVYTALRTGLIDGAENNIPSYESSKHFEVVKYYSKTEHSMAPGVVVLAKATWDKLTPEDQKLVRQAAKDSVSFQRKLWADRDAKSLKIAQDGGAQVVSDVNKKSFQDAMGPVYARFVTTPRLKDLVKRIQTVK